MALPRPELSEFVHCHGSQSLNQADCMMIIKTWANSWTTSGRYHDANPITCILGCDQKDCMSHYIRCNPFWGKNYCGTGGLCTDLVKPPAEKLCFLNANWIDLKRLCIAFKCYHVLKRGNPLCIQRAQQSGNYECVHEKLRDLVRYYAIEHRLHATRLCNTPQLSASNA